MLASSDTKKDNYGKNVVTNSIVNHHTSLRPSGFCIDQLLSANPKVSPPIDEGANLFNKDKINSTTCECLDFNSQSRLLFF